MATPPTLPDEIIGKIYIASENLYFSLTNRHLHSLLSNDFVRLQFSSHIFSHRFALLDYSPSITKNTRSVSAAAVAQDRDVVRVQTTLVNRPWFSASFACRLEAMTPALQIRAQLYENTKDSPSESLPGRVEDLRDPLSKLTFPNVPSLIIPDRNSGIGGVEMPDRLLKVPWADEKVELFRRLRRWYLDPRWAMHAHLAREIWLAWEQAKEDGQEDLVKLLQVYVEDGGLVTKFSEHRQRILTIEELLNLDYGL